MKTSQVTVGLRVPTLMTVKRRSWFGLVIQKEVVNFLLIPDRLCLGEILVGPSFK